MINLNKFLFLSLETYKITKKKRKKNCKILLFLTKNHLLKYIIKIQKKTEEVSFFLGLRFLLSGFLKKIFYNIYGLNFRYQIKLFICLFGCFFNIKILQINLNSLYPCQINLKNTQVNYDLQKKIDFNKMRLKNLQLYHGYRDNKKLSVRGQRTKTNNQTQKKKNMILKKNLKYIKKKININFNLSKKKIIKFNLKKKKIIFTLVKKLIILKKGYKKQKENPKFFFKQLNYQQLQKFKKERKIKKKYYNKQLNFSIFQLKINNIFEFKNNFFNLYKKNQLKRKKYNLKILKVNYFINKLFFIKIINFFFNDKVQFKFFLFFHLINQKNLIKIKNKFLFKNMKIKYLLNYNILYFFNSKIKKQNKKFNKKFFFFRNYF